MIIILFEYSLIVWPMLELWVSAKPISDLKRVISGQHVCPRNRRSRASPSFRGAKVCALKRRVDAAAGKLRGVWSNTFDGDVRFVAKRY